MSGATHTPGQWQACKDAACPCGAIWDASGKIHLCTAFDETALGMDAFASDIGVSRVERIANARLIAAAPDLLAACKSMLEQADDYGGLAYEVAHEAARVAIARAKGEA